MGKLTKSTMENDMLIKDIINIMKPDRGEIETAKEESRKLFRLNGFPDNTTDVLSMVVGELLDNALKFGCYKNSTSYITYSVHINDVKVIIEVKNPIDEEGNYHIKRLDKTIQWIRGHQNPLEAYMKRVKEIALMPADDAESGLGLVRVACEGKSIVDFYVNNENVISVSAVYQ
jgi:hypothetical protein